MDCVRVFEWRIRGSWKSNSYSKDFLTTSAEEIESTGAFDIYLGIFHTILQGSILSYESCKYTVVTIMVQKEVALRFNASVNTKDYNALTIILQTLCDIKMVFRKFYRTVFHPAPMLSLQWFS